MPFDSELVLIDGTITMTATTDTPAISATTRDTATGAIVIDIKETGVKGLVAVLICPADLTSTSDATYLIGYIQCSDTADMTGTVTGLETHGYFTVAGATVNRIIGSECPCVAMVRFTTKKRYVRANLTVTATFGAPQVLLSPYPFNLL